MIVKNARFVTSCVSSDAASVYTPQVCVAGRSNCGKSTLLNLLMGAKLCKTSQTPGRTRLINIFEVTADTRKFYLTDLPGYGFSKAHKAETEAFSARTDDFFRSGKNIAQALCLMDVRREPSELDKTLINYLRDLELPFTVVLTKADKLSRAQVHNAAVKIAAGLAIAKGNLIVTSGLNGAGRDALLSRLDEVLDVFDGG